MPKDKEIDPVDPAAADAAVAEAKNDADKPETATLRVNGKEYTFPTARYDARMRWYFQENANERAVGYLLGAQQFERFLDDATVDGAVPAELWGNLVEALSVEFGVKNS